MAGGCTGRDRGDGGRLRSHSPDVDRIKVLREDPSRQAQEREQSGLTHHTHTLHLQSIPARGQEITRAVRDEDPQEAAGHGHGREQVA